MIAGLWILSVLGSSCNFLTLFYIGNDLPVLRGLSLANYLIQVIITTFFFGLNAVFVALYTVPVLYEKYEDKIDAFGEKAEIELKKY